LFIFGAIPRTRQNQSQCDNNKDVRSKGGVHVYSMFRIIVVLDIENSSSTDEDENKNVSFLVYIYFM
jgi:hypothetical protein